MRRYIVSQKLKKEIKNRDDSLRDLNKKLGFEIRNIIYKNLTINSQQLEKLEDLFNKKFNLKPIYLNYGKNLGKKVFTKPIKNVKRNSQLAELIGIMLGDGNIWKNRIKIAFDKRNTIYINYVAKLFKEIFEISLKKEISRNTNNACLYRTNLYAVEELIKQGLKRGHKIKNNLGIPYWIKNNKIFMKRCIKGLIDTDGCIYKCKRENQVYVKFTNFNQQLLKDFKEITDALDYSFVKANKNNWCLYRKNKVEKFFKDIKPSKLSNGDMG